MKKYIFISVFILAVVIYFFVNKTSESLLTKTIKDTTTKKETEINITSQQKEFISTISIDYLRDLKIDSQAPVIEKELASGSNYKRYIASYISEGNKIYGLLTVPNQNPPEEGFSAIVFNHGYIPPTQYVTTEKYVAYVDSLARNNFVVFKIDLRGHGLSGGTAVGSYFSSGYTIDAISAVKSLQKLEYVNKDKIGMWGHSMAGNLVLRAMLVNKDIKAASIWAGAVYSYKDFYKYRLSDNSYVRRDRDPHYDTRDMNENFLSEIQKFRDENSVVDFENKFWKSISLTENISYLNYPVQLIHSTDDTVVNVNYARDLKNVFENNNKSHEYFEYRGGGHNIDSPYFEQAMKQTVEFFKKNL